ncbi:MAG: N-acetylmuramoyl-L-alanine amidase [Gemmatimonadales bacterium]|nr:MAG: N-acetylmuramoyl-L-alanine amidase [Gemmatimonadales bacterium]
MEDSRAGCCCWCARTGDYAAWSTIQGGDAMNLSWSDRHGPLWAAALIGQLAACGGVTPAPSAGPVPPGVIESVLPPIPSVRGAVQLHVEYPDSLQRITVSDSNFVFGSAGTGDATLIINGQFVDVNPNGSFLAFLPVPKAEAGDTTSYLLIARRGGEIDTLRHPFLLPELSYEGEPGTAWIDPESLYDQPIRWAVPGELLEFVVRATPLAEVWLDAGSERYSMTETEAAGVYQFATEAESFYRIACAPEDCTWSTEADSLRLGVRAIATDSTARGTIIAPLRILDPSDLPTAMLREPDEPAGGADGLINARPSLFGPYRWLLANGTRVTLDGRLGDRWRIRLAPGLEAWVLAEDLEVLPSGSRPPRSNIGDLRFEVLPDRLVMHASLAAALPISVTEPDDHTLELTLFGATGITNRIREGAGGRLIDRVEWEQLPGERYRLRIHFVERVWGYRSSWSFDPTGSALLRFEIRRPPMIDAASPLRGRRIAIDPGHPGAGAHGPTGYYEGDANLAIGRILARLAREAGAVPVLIRDDTLPLGLYERTQRAIEAEADVFVSIHNNALPDGVQPVGREGTSAYHYHPHSHALAVAIQHGMLSSLHLRDLGVFWGDLAVTRMSWMPAVLAEGAFMMIPSHEEALKTPEFQERYARGVLDGIEEFLRELSSDQRQHP